MSTLKLTPDRIMPAWLARPVHSPERRRFSVLCWRGWCDHEFKIRSIAAMSQMWGDDTDRPLPDLPRRTCPIPALCQCECHDGGIATVRKKTRRGRWTLLAHEWNGEVWRLAWRLDDTEFDLERRSRHRWVLYSKSYEHWYQPGFRSLYDAMQAVERWLDEQVLNALADPSVR